MGLTRTECAILILLTGGALTLILGYAWMPMNDASSHIATSSILRGVLAGDAFFTKYYDFVWSPLPYWLPTLLQEPLLAAFEPRTAFAVMMAVYAVGLPWALLQLFRLAAPENAFLAPIASLAVFSTAYWLGEAAFLLGQPLMIIAFAVFLRIESFRSTALYGFVALAVLVYLSHVFALVALLMAIGVLVLLRRRSIHRLVPAQLAAVAATAALFCLAAWFILFGHGTGANTGSLRFDVSFHHLAKIVTYPLDLPASRGPATSLAFAVLLGGLVLAPTIEGVLHRKEKLAIHLNLPIALPAAALLLMALFGPAGIDDELTDEDISQRFTIPALLFALGAVRFTGTPRRRLVIALAIGVFGIFRLADAWRVHDGYQGPADRVAAEVLAAIPEQSRVLPLMDIAEPSDREYRMHRFANYVVPMRHSYSPHVFARTGQQALRHVRWGDHRRIEDLNVTDEEWAFYDYVLVQTENLVPRVPGLAVRCDLVAAAEGFQLFRVRRGVAL